MLLKTYRAPDLATALAQARSELGPDALVLATREIAGRFGLDGVEVTVGAGRDPQPAAADPGAGALAKLAEELAGLRATIGRGGSGPAAEALAAAAAEPPTDPALAPALRALVAAGVSEDLARRFARIAARDLPPRPDPPALAEAFARGLGELVPCAGLPLDRQCLFVVGPPGAGKTTTVAKLAARLAPRGTGRVFLAQADVDRIGAFEQAEIFTRHLGIELARVDDPHDLKLVVRHAGPDGRVVVDTPGIGAADEERLALLAELREAVPAAGVVVLIPAGSAHEEARRVLARFAPLGPTGVGLSRIDDGARPGEALTAVAEAALPLVLVTNGHRVPADVEPITPRGLTSLLLRNGMAPEALLGAAS